MSVKLLLVGCGKMGSALLRRAAEREIVPVVVDPAKPAELFGAAWFSAPEKIDKAYIPDIAVIAVKPQHMADILPAYGRYERTVFLSIAAGQTLAHLQKLLGNDRAIVRSMPNLPASIGQGMSVAVANSNVTPPQKALCERLLKSIGDAAWTDNEAVLDAVTALSGSGPAYFFAMAEAMAKAGETMGLPHDLATRLARQTLIGSGALVGQSPDTVEALRKAVTSPGGTTEAALKQFFAADGLNDLVLKAMKAAAERSKDLAR